MDLCESGQTRALVRFVLFAALFREFYQIRTTTKKPGIIFVNEAFDVYWDSYESPFNDETYTIKTDGCNIPGMNFLDPSVRKFVHYPTNASSCLNSKYPLLKNNQTHIWVLKEKYYRYYNISDEKHFQCCYNYFDPQVIANETEYSQSRVRYSDCINFKEDIVVAHEFVRVICYYYGRVLYDQFFVFSPKKRFTPQRENPFEFPKNQSTYNVLIMGLASVSRLNFHRTMSNTLNFLKKKGVVEFLGYNEVLESSNNMIPLLVGMNNTELKSTCQYNAQTLLDRCPFIWERFKDAGFYTALVEDTTRYGMLNSDKFPFNGFSYNPTDYYLKPFIKEAEKTINKNSKLCMGDKYFFQVLLDYVESLTSTLKPYKLFGVFWEASMSYKHLNYPMLMDHSYESLLKKLDTSGYLNDTILILLSDHGIKFGDIQRTTQGWLEERLPFSYILTPPSFREEYSFAYENLKRNAQRLTTSFDLHTTLVDLIDLDAIRNTEITDRSRTDYAQSRGISLFLPVPSNRTCVSAGINKHSCTCLKSQQISVDSVVARKASIFLMRHLNNILGPHSQCARLTKDQIIEAMEMTNNYKDTTGWQTLMLIVLTSPGAGLFEATLRYRDYERKWELIGTVNRLNYYGEHSQCVQDYQLKLYCYCHGAV